MSSILKVNTINEVTSANGVTVDGLNIKDSKLVTANSIVAANITAANVTKDKTSFVTTSSSPGLEIKGDGTTDGTIQLNCSQNSHGVKIKGPPHSASASYTLTLPNNDGDANQFLQSNGSGVLSFASAPAGGVAGITSSANATAMTINSSEQIGIGTGSPVAPLVVSNGGASGMEFHPELTTNTNRFVNYNRSGSAYNKLKIDALEQQFFISGNEKLRLTTNGVLAANSGIAFGVGLNNTASNVLDDYEEGTWDATVQCGSGTVTIAANGNTCKYTKIGRSVLLSGSLNVSAVSSPSGDLRINGMPFASGSGEGGERATGAFCLYNPTDGLPPGLIAQIFGGYASIRIESSQAGNRSQSNHVQAGSELRFTINYQIGS